MSPRRAVALAAVVALAVGACARDDDPDGAAPGGGPVATTQPNDTSPPATSVASSGEVEVVERSLVAPDGRTRTYRTHVPAAATAGQPVELLVALHGGGGSASQFEAASGFADLAATDGVLVVFPEGYGRGRVALLRTWNAGQCCGPAVADGVDDVGFVRALVADLDEAYDVDPTRVVVAGHSNGAAMAYRLACEAADLVAAIGVQSGPLGVEPCVPGRPVSVLHVHGSGDENVPLGGGVGPEGISGVEFWPVRRGLATIAAADGCPSEPEVATVGQDPVLSIETWDECEGGSVVELVVVDGAGHAWMGPGGSGRRGDAVDVGYDASAEIWRFLSRWAAP